MSFVKKKGLYFVFFAVPVIFILFVVGGFFWWKSSLSAVSSDTSSVRFVVQKGWGAAQIGSALNEKGLIKNSFAFKLYLQVSGNTSKIQAGEYTFSPSYSLPTLVGKLLKGPDLLWVTIPEGYRLEEIARKFANDLEKEDKDTFIQEFLTSSKGREGYLFPDSYLFPKNVTAPKVVSYLENTFDTKVEQLKGNNSSGVSFDDAIIVASLLERETRTDSERPLVSGVIYKRLDAGWPLQVDASVQYAVGSAKGKSGNILNIKFWEPLTKADIEVSSPYNSYKVSTLPPTPICSPGLSSIKAALTPQASDYWFYLHDPSGEIHFAKTIEEHNANIRKYLGK